MRYIIISCQVMQREVNSLAAASGNIITPVYLPQGLHNTPALLQKAINDEIDKIENRQYDYKAKKPDAILLGYGLCSNGIVGVKAKTIPVIIPRTDDCIAIFLGSQKRYLDFFNSRGGIYWYTPGWIELGFMPGEENYKIQHSEYTELYGEDNADFLMEEENGWQSKYSLALYITSQIVDNQPFEVITKQAADYMGWKFERTEGSLALLEGLLAGGQDDELFLTCPPGYTVEQSYDNKKIKAVKTDG